MNVDINVNVKYGQIDRAWLNTRHNSWANHQCPHLMESERALGYTRPYEFKISAGA